MTYGERLKHVRNLRHMTQAEHGLACGFQNRGDVRIAQYEAGSRHPKQSVNCLLAEALHINPQILFWNVEDDNTNLYYQLMWMQLMGKNPAEGYCEIKTYMEEYYEEMDDLLDKVFFEEINQG